MTKPLELSHTYLHLQHGHVERMPVDERFWDDVISGARPLTGWLVAEFDFPAPNAAADDQSEIERDTPDGHSEVHPAGDEFHICMSGQMRAILEHDDGDEVIEFAAGQTCLIPRGTWHRLEATQASRIVSLTFGEGTQHRPSRAVSERGAGAR